MKHKHKVLFVVSALAGVVMLLDTASAQGIRSDEFNTGTLDTFWRFNDLRGGCTQSMRDTQAVISIPTGLSRDPVSTSQGGNRAPRLVQRVGAPGSDVGDFGIITKFDTVLNRKFQIQGIEAIQDDKNYVRCEIYSKTDTLVALLFTFDDAGNYNTQGQVILPASVFGTRPLLLRLDRIDSTFTQRYSSDGGINWIVTNSAIHRIKVDSVAVYAANSDSIQPPRIPEIHAPAFTCLIDYFRVVAPLPIQLASFTATLQNNNQVRLNWTTLTETNNFGFEVEKSLEGTQNFHRIEGSFIPGHGTTLEPHYYSYVDVTTSPGTWYYRLKQIDLDGTVHYTEPIRISVLTEVGENGKRTPTEFALDQNYPNPFNPSTVIKYEVARESRVTLEVFNLIGQTVGTIVDEVKPAGFYTHAFNASGLTSGVYMYKLAAGGRSFTRKMVLIK